MANVDLTPNEQKSNQVRVFLDDQEEPIVTFRPPVRFELDTTRMEDGKHTLRIEATDATGHRGIRTIPFEVRNGPGIGVEGMQDNDILDGKVPILINAYGGAREPYWEPSRAETPAPVPTWAWVLLMIVTAWSMFYIARQWNPPEEFANTPTYSATIKSGKSAGKTGGKGSGAASLSHGATLFRTSCASCHQANGEGIPGAFPALSGDSVVTAHDPTRHIEILLFGLQGKTIDGTSYSAAMPAWADQLSDEEVAAIINHERTSWGNDAPTVTAEDVSKIRAKGKD